MIKTIAQFETTLASGISKTATGGVLVSNVTGDNDGATIPDGDYGVVIDERNSKREYAVVTISGFNFTFVSRGLSFVDGSTVKSGNKFDHRKGAVIKMVTHPIVTLMTNAFNGDVPFGGIPKLPAVRTFTDPRQVVDKEYADSISASGIISMLVSRNTGITVNVNQGYYILNGTVSLYAGTTTYSLTDNATNYIELIDGVLSKNTTAFSNDAIPLAKAVCASGAITSLIDARPFYTAVDIKASNGIGRDTNGIYIDLATNPGLQFTAGQLDSKLKTNGGLLKDSNGLYLAPGIQSNYYTMTADSDITGVQPVYVKPYQADGGVVIDTRISSYWSNVNLAGATVTTSFTVGNHTNRMLVFSVVLTDNGNQTTITASFDGSAMTEVASKKYGTYELHTFVLPNPSVGSKTLSLTVSGSNINTTIGYSIYSYYNVYQTTSPNVVSTQSAKTITATGLNNGSVWFGSAWVDTAFDAGIVNNVTNLSSTCLITSGDSGQQFPAGIFTATWSTSASNLGVLVELQPVTTPSFRIAPTNASLASTSNSFIGFSTGSISAGNAGTIQIAGIVSGLTNLQASGRYYLGNSAGIIQLVSGTVSRKIGIALSATELLLTNNW